MTLTGPTVIDTSTQHEYTLVINSIGSQTMGGLNVAAPTGGFYVGGADAALTKIKLNSMGRREITHTTSKSEVAGEIRFSFLWRAPTTPQVVTLEGWGNAVNGANGKDGDMAALASLAITVNQGPPVAVPASAPWSQAALALLLVLASAGLLLRRAPAGARSRS